MGAVYSQLSVQERRKIEDWWHAKVPVREMARVLKRHKSTIFREIKRNFWAMMPSRRSMQDTSVTLHNCRRTNADPYSAS